jgi:hypothetical protein
MRLLAIPEVVTDPEGTFLGAVEALAGARTWRRRLPAGASRSSVIASRGRRWSRCYKNGRGTEFKDTNPPTLQNTRVALPRLAGRSRSGGALRTLTEG